MKTDESIFADLRYTSVEKNLHSSDKSYFNYYLQWQRWVLKPLGIWPNNTISSRLFSIVNISVCIFFLLAWFVPCVLGMIIEQTDKNTLMKNIGPVLYCLMAAMKYCSLIMHKSEVKICLEHLKEDWRLIERVNDRKVMIVYASMGRYLTAFCVVFMHCGIIVHNVVMTIPSETIIVDNETIVLKILPFPFYNKIIDSRFSPVYEIIFLGQCVSGLVINSITVGACSLAAVFVLHAHGQLKILIDWLERLVEGSGEKDDTLKKRIKCIVEHHVRVLSFIALVEYVMNFIFLVEVIGCTFIICLIGYYSLTEWEQNDAVSLISYSILLTSFTFNIFISCLMGEILTEQCSKIGNAAYMTEWYRLPHKSALNLVLIISRSSNVIRMTAGKFIHLSMASFGDVMRTSVFYLNILRTVTT